MVIWGNGPGEAGDEPDDGSPSGVSRGMVKVICPVLTARDGETDLARGTAPCPDPAMLAGKRRVIAPKRRVIKGVERRCG